MVLLQCFVFSFSRTSQWLEHQQSFWKSKQFSLRYVHSVNLETFCLIPDIKQLCIDKPRSVQKDNNDGWCIDRSADYRGYWGDIGCLSGRYRSLHNRPPYEQVSWRDYMYRNSLASWETRPSCRNHLAFFCHHHFSSAPRALTDLISLSQQKKPVDKSINYTMYPSLRYYISPFIEPKLNSTLVIKLNVHMWSVLCDYSRHRKDTEQHHIDDDYQHDYVTQSYEAALAHQSQQATDTVKRTKMTATLQRQPHHLCLGARLAGTNEINQNDDVSDFCALQPTDCRGLNVTTEPLLPPAGVGYQSALCTVAHPHFYDAPSCDERPSRQNQSRRVKLQT